MITMTTRSSRFFVVLLHLVGVSTHLPTSFSGGRGIVGVNPLSIVLETLDPSSLAPGQFDRDNSDSRIQLLHGQPHWLQDALGDQTCLDPMGGFSECGDATLWLVIPKKSSRRQARWRKWVTWATEEEETEENTSNSRIQGYALQLYDDTHQQHITQPSKRQVEPTSSMDEIASSLASSSFTSPYMHYHAPPSKDDWSDKECLTRRRKDNQLILVPCSQDRAWAWHFNEFGILHFKKPKSSSPLGGNNGEGDAELKREKHKRLLKTNGKKTLECMARNASQAAILIPCDGSQATPLSEARHPERVLQIGLVRQATADSTLASKKGHRPIPAEVHSLDEQTALGSQPGQRLPPSQKHIAYNHASAHTERVQSLKRSPSLASLSGKHSVPPPSGSTGALPLTFFKNSNPILLANDHVGLSGSPTKNTKESKPLVAKSGKRTSDSASSSGPAARARPMVRKIQTNPYISESQNERWTDPLTGLVYHTDLCHYLGHDRNEVGRHTLTGVGQYMKTIFNIKVYGVAFYVSKRDLLADPVMEQYATHTADELRQQPDFYETLRHMTPSSNKFAGSFDRTLFLKTNMQLATDTMRSSLDADWKMLTQEAKDLMIGSSMKPRPANEAMMEVIQSPDNPSKCSCAQVAPEEYQADPACCARGTELVFTWRKSGALEVRLNGNLMDSFDRPDIAAAIFYEYLRTDDPMSFDFLEKVVNGFPMLLGPLAQVKGVSSPSMAHSSPPSSSQKASSGQNPLTRALEGFGGALSSGASNVVDLVHHGATELSTGAMSAARSMGDAAKNLGEEMERRRDLIGQHVSHFAHQTISSIYGGGKDQKTVATLPKWLETMPLDIPFRSEVDSTTKASRGRIFKDIPILSKLFGTSETASMAAPDEIVPMIHPSANSTQRLFLGVVHLYLLLILIVSFPAPLTTRTKLVISRKSKLNGVQPVSDSDSEEGSSIECDQNGKAPKSKVGINRGFPSFGQRPYLSSNL